MIHIAVCDDEKQICEYLKKAVNEYFAKADIDGRVSVFSDGAQLLALYESETPDFDLILLDINMPGTDGFTVASRIREKNRDVMLVFITASAEYVFRGYEVNAFRYLLKPDLVNGFERVFSDCIAQLTRANEVRFTFQTGAETNWVPVRDILYFESDKRKVIIHCANAKEYSYYEKLDAVQAALKKNDFVRCHQSFLINAKKIVSLSVGEVTLTGDVRIPVSKHRQKETNEAFLWAMR